MTWTRKLLLALIFLGGVPPAAAQANLGELLDAGAERLSADDFRRQVVQRIIVGPSPAGATLELMYTDGGTIQGTGIDPYLRPAIGLASATRIFGNWNIDESERICSSMRINLQSGGSAADTFLPPRCQFWFKLGERYFICDSDSDRRARVLVRTLKQ